MKCLTLLLLTAFAITKLYSQMVAVSGPHANIFYQKLDNPLTVVIEKCACEDVVVKTSNGTLTGSGCQYTYKAGDCTFETTIKVGTKKDSNVNWLTETHYRVEPVPDPVESPDRSNPIIKLSKTALIANGRINILHPNPDLCTCPEIGSYYLLIIRDSIIFKSANVSNNLTAGKAYEFIKNNCTVGDVLIFDDVEFKNEKRILPPFTIRIVSL